MTPPVIAGMRSNTLIAWGIAALIALLSSLGGVPTSGSLDEAAPGGAPSATFARAEIHDEPGFTAPDVLEPRKNLPGIDVSANQHGVDWQAVRQAGGRYAFIKATESTDYTNARLVEQYRGAAKAGLVRGAYHYAHPSLTSTGVAQGTYFVRSLLKLGGGKVDGATTLPPVLDLEYGPSDACWGLTPEQMVGWVSDFTNTVANLTGRTVAIYTSANWWNTCTGSNTTFGSHPLYLARYLTDARDGPDALPAGWKKYAFWQYTSSGSRFWNVTDGSAGDTAAWDQDAFAGSLADLRRLARH